MCGCEFNLAAAGRAIAGGVLGHFSSRSDISAIYNSAMSVEFLPKLSFYLSWHTFNFYFIEGVRCIEQ